MSVRVILWQPAQRVAAQLETLTGGIPGSNLVGVDLRSTSSPTQLPHGVPSRPADV